MSVNACTFIGRFGRDHQLRYTPKGNAVLENSIATGRKYKDGNGHTQEETTWIDVKAWGKTAEFINNYTGKGALIYLQCRATNETWNDKQTGQERRKTVFVVERFEFLESADKQATRAESRAQQPAAAGTPNHTGTGAFDDDEGDDIPF